jgi:hypothetical protein
MPKRVALAVCERGARDTRTHASHSPVALGIHPEEVVIQPVTLLRPLRTV